jgi:hypothetical protein
MHTLLRSAVTTLLLLLGTGAEAQSTGTATPADGLRQLLDSLCPPMLATSGCVLGDVERRWIVEDVYEYSVPVKAGPGPHDVIQLHRVVREEAPWVPIHAPTSVFMIHGDAWSFRGAYLSGAPGDDGRSIAAFLARNGVDVWGLDLRWTQVPLETGNFSFMKAWNLGTHVEDVGLALRMARAVRIHTRSGAGKLHLLGWSRGALVASAFLGEETQRVPAERLAGGFIPVDMVLRFGPEDELLRKWACDRYEAGKELFDGGRYEGGLLGAGAGIGLQRMGTLALTAPDAESPLSPPLSNRQMALFAASVTWRLFAPHPPAVPDYHLLGGQLEASGPPTGLSYTPEARFFELLSQAHPYQAFAETVDSDAILCGTVDVPYDDHLPEIDVPVLYVGAAGGFGHHGVHATTLLASTDVSTLVVQRHPGSERALDYGHADLFLADDAEASVWRPLLDWLRRH